MKPKSFEYSEHQFSNTFFQYDVAKHRTETAIPFDEQGLWWHFSDYEKPDFSKVDELDSIFRYISEVDSNLADEFVQHAKAELDELFYEVHERLEGLIDRYTYQYAHDEDYVKMRLRALMRASKPRVAA